MELKDLENIREVINQGFKEPAKISIEKRTDNTGRLTIEGCDLSVLITLAGLEKTILEKLGTSKSIWEMIKSAVGVMEVKEHE